MHNSQTLTNNSSFAVSSSFQIATAVLLGIGLFMLVGFAPMEVVHNAAHDTRHAFAFPCH
ncbi:MAG: CbtB domain-containing protein [Oceanospirillaceae bacterium]